VNVTSDVRRTTRRRALVHSVMIVGALALGLGLAFGVHVVADHEREPSVASANVRGALARALASQGGVSGDGDTSLATAASDGQSASAPVDEPDAPDAAASSPDEAVRRFLDFELARDFEASYGLLGTADRARAVTRAGWSEAHADVPVITGYALGTPEVVNGRTEVPAEVMLRAALTPGAGIVPSRATVRFHAVAEDGGWRVAFDESRLVPHFPADIRAPAAVRAWAQTRVRCQQPREYAAGLIGAAARADALCGSDGPIRTGRARRLPETAQDQPFLAAFGGEVHDWARVVRVESPVPMDVVVAPLGEQWLVVGVLQAPLERR
jgi:hypothetical protein